MDQKETRALMERYGIIPTKSLGQNFLVDGAVRQRIADRLDPDGRDLVIEIGPGTGELSALLDGRCARLILIEIDRHLIPLLQERFAGSPGTVILYADALKEDLPRIARDALAALPPGTRTKILSNLPYYITTPLITRLVMGFPDCERMVFTLQAEAAERLLSPAGTSGYGVLPVLIRLLYDTSLSSVIPPSCFYPRPDVGSVTMTLNSKPDIRMPAEERIRFERFLKAAFGQKRKTLANALAGAGYLAGGRASAEEALAGEGLPAGIRAQQMSPETLLRVCRRLTGG